MSLPKEEVISILHSLIEICRDGNQGFRDAGDDVKDDKLRSLLYEYSDQRMNFSLELKDIVEKMGGDINVGGSILGAFHRRWMDIKFGVIGSKTDSILNECLRGEHVALKKYEDALIRGLPDDVKNVVQRQYNEIKKAVENLNKLVETYGLSSFSY
ncbi:MAG TPA: PA2169 family four-helix-bundle protein [Ignavibacteria bacterium]|jgi:uncharacterized protein (TIGR02284 family)